MTKSSAKKTDKELLEELKAENAQIAKDNADLNKKISTKRSQLA